MKFIAGQLIILLLISGTLAGQNLCTNGDFETYTTLPNNYAQVCYANGWSSPSGACALVVGTGSPDYYNTGGTGGCKPPTTWWATVTPHSGAGMEGFAAWYSGNYREYIARQLSTPLTIGQVYTVSLWYTNGVSTIHGYGCNNFGIAFSAVPLTQSGGTPISYVPQLESSAILFSTTWQKLSFLYTPTSADQYITIGNFRTNAATSISLLGSGTTGSYYYIDDVSITPGNSLPVELLSFTADAHENETVLRWVTETEINNDYFTLERGKNENDFQKIAQVEGAGNSSSLREYSYSDPFPENGITYYRLSQTDFDGTINHSKTIACRKNNTTVLSWNYLPDSKTITILFREQPGNHTFIRLIDLQGRTIYHSESIQEKELVISTWQFPQGIYALEIEADNFHSTAKISIFN